MRSERCPADVKGADWELVLAEVRAQSGTITRTRLGPLGHRTVYFTVGAGSRKGDRGRIDVAVKFKRRLLRA